MKKIKFKEAIGEIVVELVLTFVLFGVGILVFKLFGLNIDWEQTDPDLLVLVGVGAIATVALIFGAVVYISRKLRTGKNSHKDK